MIININQKIEIILRFLKIKLVQASICKIYSQQIKFNINLSNQRRSAKQREDQIRDISDYAPTFNAYTNYHGKSLSSEFKALNQINTWHMDHKSDNKSPVKVPLSCIVTYRGFKALVQSISPDAEGLVHGPIFNQEKYYQGYKTHPQIEPLLQQLGEDLGIKPHYFRYGNKPKCKIYLSFVTEVHYNQRIQNLRQQIKDPEESSTQKVETYYLKNVGDIFPVNDNYLSESSKYKVIQFRHEYLKKLNKPLNPDAFEDQDQDSTDDVEDLVQASLYLENTFLNKFVNDIDELNYQVIDSLTLGEEMHKQGINMKYLGYIASHTTIPFIMNVCVIDMVARAFKKILNSTISDLYLQSNKWVTVEDQSKKQPSNNQAQSLQKAQTFGVTKNNSQVQLSASQTIIPQQPSQTSLNNGNGSQSNQRIKEYRIRQLDELVRDAIIDILNMMFGKDEESDRFHEILNQQVRYDFNYTQYIDIKSLKKGQLLESLCFHCELNMVYSADLFIQYEKRLSEYLKLQKNNRNQDDQEEVQKQIYLFTKDHYIDHYVSSQVFTMDCLNVMQYIKHHQDKYENPESFEQQINSIKQHINVLKYSNSLSFFKYIQLLSIISKLYLQKKDFLSAGKTATEVIALCTKKIDEDLVIVPNIHLVKAMITLIQISLKKDISEEVKNMTVIATKNIMKMIKFVVDESHPLFFQLTRVFINDKIKKKDIPFENMKQVMESELNGLIRALGSNHLHTADRYKDFAIYLYENDPLSSLLYFEKAYNIYSFNQEQQDSEIASQLINPVQIQPISAVQKNIAESRANCAYYLCNIYFNQNKIELCWNFLKISLNHFQNKKDYLDKLCKLYLLRCNLVKRNNMIKQIVDECEQTWRFFDNYPYGKVKLLDYYRDLLKMYIETIVSTWNRNYKAQFDSITSTYKEIVEKSNKFSEKVRQQAIIQKDSAFQSSLANVQVSDSLRQSIDLSSPSNNLSPLSKQNKQLLQKNIQMNNSALQKGHQLIGLNQSQFQFDRSKKVETQHQSLQSLDETVEVSYQLLYEEKIHFLINSINQSNQEVWRYIEKQFLILGNMKPSKIQYVYQEKENILKFHKEEVKVFGNYQLEQSQPYQEFVSVNFFEALFLVLGYPYLQRLFYEY